MPKQFDASPNRQVVKKDAEPEMTPLGGCLAAAIMLLMIVAALWATTWLIANWPA